MKRLMILGSLTGLLTVTVGSGTTYSQLPPLPGETLTVPSSPETTDELAPIPLPPAPSTMNTPDLNPQEVPSQSQMVPPPVYPAPTRSANAKVPPYYGSTVVPGINTGPTAWQPGGYSARRGSPYYYTTPGRNQPLYSVHEMSGTPWAFDHSAYGYHFGPGYYRHSAGGHYRFPYYTYRAHWYFPGHPIYNRDTNRPW
ncbi:MAG: hypothetical protein KDA84_28125 [Planctomycetaceae bacterium]|nr:hypothetical protein [Planctomycetaceae bacterium]